MFSTFMYNIYSGMLNRPNTKSRREWNELTVSLKSIFKHKDNVYTESYTGIQLKFERFFFLRLLRECGECGSDKMKSKSLVLLQLARFNR